MLKWQGYDDADNTWEPAQNLQCDNLIAEFEEEQRRLKLGQSSSKDSSDEDMEGNHLNGGVSLESRAKSRRKEAIFPRSDSEKDPSSDDDSYVPEKAKKLETVENVVKTIEDVKKAVEDVEETVEMVKQDGNECPQNGPSESLEASSIVATTSNNAEDNATQPDNSTNDGDKSTKNLSDEDDGTGEKINGTSEDRQIEVDDNVESPPKSRSVTYDEERSDGTPNKSNGIKVPDSTEEGDVNGNVIKDVINTDSPSQGDDILGDYQNLVVEKVLKAAVLSDEKAYFLIKFKGIREPKRFLAKEANRLFPSAVISFYESRIKWT